MSKEFVASSNEVDEDQKLSVGNKWLQDLERIYKAYLETAKNQSPDFMDAVE